MPGTITGDGTGQNDDSKLRSPAAVSRSQNRLWVVFCIAGVLSLAILIAVWSWKRPATGTLWFELAKSCLQILGVAVVGGVITLTINSWHEARKQAAEDLERQRTAQAAQLERQRELFQLRASLLHRTAQCAQKMYVVCQHIRRIQKDLSKDPSASPASPPSGQLVVSTETEARAMLDKAYLEFSAEAAALKTEIGARYRPIVVEESSQPPSGGRGAGYESETYLHWHQIDDLLTVYYFALCGNFRVDILKNNSPRDGQRHSGIDFTKLVPRPNSQGKVAVIPTPEETRAVIEKIRTEFLTCMPALASHALREKIVDSEDPSSAPGSALPQKPSSEAYHAEPDA